MLLSNHSWRRCRTTAGDYESGEVPGEVVVRCPVKCPVRWPESGEVPWAQGGEVSGAVCGEVLLSLLNTDAAVDKGTQTAVCA